MFRFSVAMGLVVALAGAHFAGHYLRNVSDAYNTAFQSIQSR